MVHDTTLKLNLDNISLEMELLLDILRMEDSKNIIETYQKKDVNWNLFLKLCYHHRMYPLVYKKLQHNNFKSLIPIEYLRKLEHSYKTNTLRMLFLSAELEKLNEQFHKRNIQMICLKGPVLAKELYEDLSERTCSDLDVLVPLHELSRVNDVLLALGFRKDEYIQSILGDWKWRHHHFAYIHPTKGTKVEVHWRLNPSPSSDPSFDTLWNRRKITNIGQAQFASLSNEDTLYFLLTHGARHGWSRVRWLYDVKKLLQKTDCLRPLDLKKLWAEKEAAQAMILLENLLWYKISKKQKAELSITNAKGIAQDALFYIERMVNLHQEPLDDEVSTFHTAHLLRLMNWKRKLVYTMSILHPFYTDAEVVPLPPKLHFMYFPLRPFLWLWRKRKKQQLT